MFGFGSSSTPAATTTTTNAATTAAPSLPRPDDEEADDDFKALLGRTKDAVHQTDDPGTSTQSFCLDHLMRGQKQDVSPANYPRHLNMNKKTSSTSSTGGVSPSQFCMLLLQRCASYVNMLCYFYPTLCGTLVFVLIGASLWGLGTLVFNPRVQYGVMKHHAHDHAFMDSQYNLKAGDIDHWCLRGDNDSCQCEDPLQPSSRADRQSWRLAFTTNRKITKALAQANWDLDVLFLGESVVEEMDGRWMGQGRSPTLQQMHDLFHSTFDKSREGAKVNAAALGIAGDTAPNVLWRLIHGETEGLQPKIFWLSLGMNDLSRMQCSEEVVVLGILRVVEEILIRYPSSHIVINSLFPMTKIRGAAYPTRDDYQDSFPALRKNNNKRAKTADVSLQVPKKKGNNNNNNNNNKKKHERARQLLEQQHQQQQQQRELKRNKKKQEPEVEPVPLTKEQAADAEDARLEAQAKKPRKKFKLFGGNKDKKDPVLKVTHKIRKHVSDTKLPLWTSILEINKDLRSFCADQDRVTFYDVTNLFAQRQHGNQYHLNSELISNTGHPTQKGFEVWEQAVAAQAQVILQDLLANSPELFDNNRPTTTTTTTTTTTDDANNYDDAVPLTDILDWDNMPEDDDVSDDYLFYRSDDGFDLPGIDGDDDDDDTDDSAGGDTDDAA